jgi:hypothetical protein
MVNFRVLQRGLFAWREWVCVFVSGHVLHLVGEVAARSRRGQRLAVLAIEVDRFFNDLAELFKYLLLIVAMATAEN